MRRWATLVAALLILNCSLTFENVWPTPSIRWEGELSIELAACLLLLVLAHRRLGPPSRTALRWTGAFWVLLVVGRYADVTAPALYGRDINLYWDLQFIPDVAAMLARAVPLWLVIVTGVTAAAILLLLYVPLGWALGRIGDALSGPHERRGLAWLASAMMLLFAGQRLAGRVPGELDPSTERHRPFSFAAPVMQTYARQTRLIIEARTGAPSFPPGPAMKNDLTRVKGADVLLIFMESYGAVSYDRPEFADRLAGSRAELATAIRETNREVVSTFVESPTFGGASWLAHLSFMSGVEVRDAGASALLMTQKRETLVTTFAEQGYRTVAVVPALKQPWPEGVFYGFDAIYGGERLAYQGPEFGWFAIPDQFSIARWDALEVNRQPRPPLFLFFATISTHLPFGPTPPYQPDWRRVLTEQPYDEDPLNRALSNQPDYTDFGPDYVDSVAYVFQSIGGYLRMRADRDFIMILLGDHQPPAAVTSEGARWDVPVHVIARRTDVLDRLVARGFQAGLTPTGPSISRMHALMPMLVDAFGER